MHIFFTDVDGTVYPSNHVIHPQLFKDIRQAQDKNVEVVLCTGNGFFDNIQSLASKLNVKYVVAANGASIFDTSQNGKLLFASPLKRYVCQKLWAFAKQNQIMVSGWDVNFVFHNEFCSRWLVERVKHFTTKKGNIKLLKGIPKDQIKLEFFGTKAQMNKAALFLAKHKVETARMNDKHIEITNPGVDKGSGAKWIMGYLKVDPQNTASAGDSPNDIPLFKVTNVSYALDNATQNLKAVATNFSADVTQNGLGLAIVDYLHREKLDR